MIKRFLLPVVLVSLVACGGADDEVVPNTPDEETPEVVVPSNPPTNPVVPPTDLVEPPADPVVPPTDPVEPPVDPAVPPTDPVEPPVDPAVPPTDPVEPPVDPAVPPTDPVEPPVDPAVPPTDPVEPPVDPAVPPTDPVEPPIEPVVPPIEPVGPPTDPVDPPSDPGIPPTDPIEPPVNTAAVDAAVYCREIEAVSFDTYAGIAGYTSATRDTKNNIDVLQIADRGATAAAQQAYDGRGASVIFKINTMQEVDGEPTYIVKLNGDIVGSVKNTSINGTDTPEYSIEHHVVNYEPVALQSGDQIQVEFTNHTNGLVVEDDSTATARGRWENIEVCSANPQILRRPVPYEPAAVVPADGECKLGGELSMFQRAELVCAGPDVSEADERTFTDYRFNVEFTKGDQSIMVPGHYAADGSAADTSADEGNKWRAYFAPPSAGEWRYRVSFRSGNDVAIRTEPFAGRVVRPVDGASGTFTVGGVNASLPDLRARGFLEVVDGERFMRFSNDGTQFMSAGVDSPENIFGYFEMDNTIKFDNVSSCKGILHEFEPHLSDWQESDPYWGDDKGKSIFGLVNYIASRNLNVIYMMGNTVSSDGCDAHPWTEYNASGDVKSFDVSKLDQWERVIRHMERNGIMLHYMTQEQENDQLLNNGALELERKLYYREIISRFAHHPGLQWNLGEENTNTDAQRKAFADYFKANDPYNHAVMMHTWPEEHDDYNGMLGHPTFDGATIQIGSIDESGDESVYAISKHWLDESSDAGKPWIVTFTEASGRDAPRPYDEVTTKQRVKYMWASAMAGGAGFEWYLKGPVSGRGSVHAYDLAVEDLREFDSYWKQAGYFSTFFEEIVQIEKGVDLNDLSIRNGLTSTSSDWVLAKPGVAFIIYLREGGTTNLNLADTMLYDVTWFNPRTGESHTGIRVQGEGETTIGFPPNNTGADWVALVTPSDDQNDGPTNTANYVERDGLVVMEAENTTSPLGNWEIRTGISGYTGSGHLYFTGNTPLNGPADSPLEYTFKINTPGVYRLEMRMAREDVTINGEVRDDVANDGYVRVEGDYTSPSTTPLNFLTTDTKFFGGAADRWRWPHIDTHLDRDDQKWDALYEFKEGETYTFVLSGRSQRFRVDRIVFSHSSVSESMARSTNQDETN